MRYDGALVNQAKALTLNGWFFWRGAGLADAENYNETTDGVLLFGMSGANGHLKVCAQDGEQGGFMSFAGGRYNEDAYAVAQTALPMNQWCMVTAVIDGANMTLYLDGQQIASAAQTVTPDQLSLDLFRIGSSFWGPVSLNALVDDAAVWQRALSAEEITALYDGIKAQ